MYNITHRLPFMYVHGQMHARDKASRKKIVQPYGYLTVYDVLRVSIKQRPQT